MAWLRTIFVLVFVSAGLAMTAQAAPGNSLRMQITDERGMPVRDAVVELASSRNPSGPIRFPWRMAMAQKDQQFVPGTLIVAKGSTVAFPNLDRVRHSIYSFSRPARFTIELYGRNQTRTHDFPISGTVALGCNIHDGMRGYIRITETPFAGKTDANGYVALDNIPAGTARLTVWHPRLRAPGNETSKGVTIATGAQSRKLGVRLR